MKRLAIILAVLVMGMGLSMWCFGIEPAGVIPLAAAATEGPPPEQSKPADQPDKPVQPIAEKGKDANVPAEASKDASKKDGWCQAQGLH